jgi:hypothetical protein
MKNEMGQVLSLDDYRRSHRWPSKKGLAVGASIALVFYTAVGLMVWKSNKNAPPLKTPQTDHFMPVPCDFTM